MNEHTGPRPRQRLHPLSPLLHGAKSLTVAVGALSWSTLERLGLGWFAVLAAILTGGGATLALIHWYNTGYEVVGRELRVYEGLLWRRTRAIPLERLQAVEVVQPLLARLTGLAELRLEVVGGGKTEAPLAFLDVADAVTLRQRLLFLAGATAMRAAEPYQRLPHIGPEQTVPAAEPDADMQKAAISQTSAPLPPAGLTLHLVANRDLVVSQLLTPQAILLPFGLAFVVAQFLSAGSWSFIAVASTLTAMAGVVLQPARRILDDWDFRLAWDGPALRVRHGLLETRTQTVPGNRIQAIEVTWPLLWRVRGWLRLRLVVAGYSATEPDDRNRPDRLLPVGDLTAAELVTAEVLRGVQLATLPLTPPPARARWRHPLTQQILGAGLTEQVFAARHGLLTRQLVLVPYARIQSVRVVRGPVQRWLGLANVHVDTAGGSQAIARDRDVLQAWALAAELTARARAARHPR